MHFLYLFFAQFISSPRLCEQTNLFVESDYFISQYPREDHPDHVHGSIHAQDLNVWSND